MPTGAANVAPHCLRPLDGLISFQTPHKVTHCSQRFITLVVDVGAKTSSLMTSHFRLTLPALPSSVYTDKSDSAVRYADNLTANFHWPISTSLMTLRCVRRSLRSLMMLLSASPFPTSSLLSASHQSPELFKQFFVLLESDSITPLHSAEKC